jgi:hypothetical protein
MACGDDGAVPVDAGDDGQVTDDAPIDAPPTTGQVTVTINDDGAGVEGIDVYFQNPDGSLVAKVATSASGVASATVDTGAWVTVVDPYSSSGPLPTVGAPSHTVKTWAGVEPGDRLVMERSNGEEVPAATVTVTVPAINNLDNAEVYSTCGEDLVIGESDTITLWGCGGTADMIVIAYDGEDQPLGYFYKAGVAITDGGTVNLSTETYAAVPDATFTFSNFPAEFSGLNWENGLVSSRGGLFSLEGGVELSAGGATVEVERPLATPTMSFLTMQHANAQAFHVQFSWQATAATHPFDATNKVLPSYTAAPTYDAATREVSWTSTGSNQPDATILELYASRDALSWSWEVVAPYDGTEVTLPALPTDIAQYVPLATDNVGFEQLGAARLPGGYDAIRPIFFASTEGPPVTGTSGDISIVQWAAQGVSRTAPSKHLFANAAQTAQRSVQKAAMKAKLAKARAAAKSNKMTKRAR